MAQEKGIGLIRVSTSGQAKDDRGSIPAQRDMIQAIARKNNIDVVRVFELADLSGADVVRSPEYREFLKALEPPEIGAVLTREFSRLMRPDSFDDLWVLEHLVKYRIKLYFAGGDSLDPAANPQARFMLAIKAAVSGLERAEIAFKSNSGKEAIRKAGRHPSGNQTLAHGLRYSKAAGWSYDENEIAQVRLLYRLFLGGETRYDRLAEIVGMRPGAIPVILRNPVYMGLMTYRQKKDPTRGKGFYLPRAPEDVVTIRLPLEPVVTEDQHREVLRIMAAKRRGWDESRAHGRSPEFTYRGFLYCGACHAPMYPWTTTKDKQFYLCRSSNSRYRKKGSPPPCSNKALLKAKIEGLIETRLRERLLDPVFLTGVLAAHFRRQATDRLPDLDALARSRFDALEGKRRRVLDLYEDGNINRLEKNERLRDLDREHEALCAIRPVEQAPRVDPAAIVDSVVETLVDFPLSTLALKREILQRVIPEIYVHRYVVQGVTLSLGSDKPTGSTTDPFVTTFPKSHDSRIYIPFETALV